MWHFCTVDYCKCTTGGARCSPSANYRYNESNYYGNKQYELKGIITDQLYNIKKVENGNKNRILIHGFWCPRFTITQIRRKKKDAATPHFSAVVLNLAGGTKHAFQHTYMIAKTN